MTNNEQRAAEIIGKVMSRWDMDGRPDVSGGIDTCLAQALADAGLLMPDLPEFHENGPGNPEITGRGFQMEIAEDEVIICDRIAFWKESLRGLGLALLAADKEMEEYL